MAGVSLTLPPNYWENLALNKKDLESINTHLFENETPLGEEELVPIVIQERIHSESESLVKHQKSLGRIFYPKEQYKPGEKLVFPALGWKNGKVTSARPGVNPSIGAFDVIEVELEDGTTRKFAARLEDHKLNQPVEIASNDPLLNPENIFKVYGTDIKQKLAKCMASDDDLVKVAMRWFPRALLVDINEGHLNLAEAILDEAGGKPLSTKSLSDQIDLPSNVNPKLLEFSINYALQKDGRFDEVGPSGEVLWYLKRLEPEDVRQIPAPLRYIEIPYDRSLLTPGMLALEAELDDELADVVVPVPAYHPESRTGRENESPAHPSDEVTISLNYAHWRAGTLPISARMKGLFPSAYESPRVRFTLVDGQSHEEMPGWVIRERGYVYGLGKLYQKYGLMPGSLVSVAKGKKAGQTVVTVKTRRPTRDWVRTVLVGSDGGIVFAMLKQNLTSEFNERMVIAVPDTAGVDDACNQINKQRPPFEALVAKMMAELVKLNVQGHVHAQELYSAINIVRRCPPGALLAFLTSSSHYKHVGDLHYRLAESEGGNE